MHTIDAYALHHEARQYYHLVREMKNKKRFNNQMIAHLASMSAEKFMVSYLATREAMPMHHSLDFLVDEVARVHPHLPLHLINEVYFLEEFQNLCILGVVENKIPTDAELDRIVELLAALNLTLFS